MKLPYGEENIAIHIDAKDLPYGFTDTAVVDIQTNGGDSQITVNLNTTNIIYEDDFTNPSSGWTVSSDDVGEANYIDGGYRLSIKQPGHIIAGVNPSIGQLSDFVIEFDMQSMNTSSDMSYGIVLRQKDMNRFDNFYYFQIVGNEGEYRIEKQFAGTWSTLEEANAAEHIKSDGTVNHVKIICTGPQLSFYINDFKLVDIEDDSFLNGFIALSAMSGIELNSPVDVIFDNMKIYSPLDT